MNDYTNSTEKSQEILPQKESDEKSQASIFASPIPVNAFRIHPHSGVKLTTGFKTRLKKMGCSYNHNYKGYVGSLQVKEIVEALFSESKISADFIEFFYPLPFKSKSINSLDVQTEILQREIQDQENRLTSQVELYDSTRGIYDFEDPPEQCTTEDDTRDESRYVIEMGYHKDFLEIREKKEKLKNLRNSLHLHVQEKDIDSKVLEALYHNEVGDANLFADMFKEKYEFDPRDGKEGSFFGWKENQWELDLYKGRYNDLEAVSRAYIEEPNKYVQPLEESVVEELKKRSTQLEGINRMRNVMNLAAIKMPFSSRWDYAPGRLPVQNGMVDLKTGVLTPPNRKDYIRHLCSVEYNPNAECPNFLSFLNDISLENQEWIDFLQLLIGYAVFGDPTENIIVYWYGKGGRNGKGTLANMLQDILGNMARTFPTEMLLMQRNLPSSNAANPELANLQGVRLAMFSEINEGRRIDSAKVKILSGGDVITCRRLFSNKDLQITPNHTLFLQSNYKPKAPADDNALWARTILLPFKVSFLRDPKEGCKYEKPLKIGMQEELSSEYEGILRWVVDGCKRYAVCGLVIPQFIKDETAQYRKENDGIALFLEEMCDISPEWSTPKINMETSIKKYLEDNGFERFNRLEISSYLKSRFSENRSNKGKVWLGVKIEENQN